MDLKVIAIGSALALVTGVANRLRGGALNDYLAGKGYGRVSHTITRAIVVLLSVTSIYIALGVDPFQNTKSSVYSIAVFLSIFIIGMLPGWGAYFDLGHTKRDYVDHREVLWIDWVLCRFFGPIWIPFNPSKPTAFEREEKLQIQYPSFDLIYGPNGRGRPKPWKKRRDFWGMNLRGLHFFFPASIFLYLQTNIIETLILMPFGLLFGSLYALSNHISIFGFRSTHLGEILTGSVILSGLPYFFLINI